MLIITYKVDCFDPFPSRSDPMGKTSKRKTRSFDPETTAQSQNDGRSFDLDTGNRVKTKADPIKSQPAVKSKKSKHQATFGADSAKKVLTNASIC